jgi:hypothetical protein
MPMTTTAWSGVTENVVTSAARTATGNSGTLTGYGPAASLRAQLNVTAASGTTPTLDVVIQDSVDGGTNWNTIGTFAQKTTTGREVINILPLKAESATFQPIFSDTLRVLWTIGGTTPSFTFAVDWTATGAQG